MVNLTYTIRAFFSKIRALFLIFKKGKGGLPPSPSHLPLPLPPRSPLVARLRPEHISKLCNKSAGQLNALCRIRHLTGLEERKMLINSFIYSNFNYCPFVWHFSSRKSINKIENIQKRALRFLLNDYSSDYETLLKKN